MTRIPPTVTQRESHRPRRARLVLAAVVTASALVAGTAAPLAAVAEPLTTATGLVAWGTYSTGAPVSRPPSDLTDVTAVAAGWSHDVALRGDGTVVAWGDDSNGKTDVPAGLTEVTAIAAGRNHSLALRSDGTVTGWGWNAWNQVTPPSDLGDVTAVAAGDFHSLAVRGDGSVIAWGDNSHGQTTVPAELTNAVAVSAGVFHSLALRNDGTVVAWGDNSYGQATVPAGLSDVIAISAGGFHNLALRRDGSVVAWGHDSSGQTDVPSDLSGVTAIASGYSHSLALSQDGTVTAWGSGARGQTSVPVELAPVTAISANFDHNIVVGARPVFTADAPPATATVGIDYGYVFDAGDFSSFAVVSGALPDGLVLTLDGELLGAPATEGTFTFTVSATNSFGSTSSAEHTITVGPNLVAPTISGTVAAGMVGSAYDFTYSVTGSPTPTVALQSGTLPPGLTLDSSGHVSGTPTTAGTYTYTVEATNTVGTATARSTLTVSPQKVTTKADLRVDLTGPSSAKTGDTYDYVLTTKNAGPSTSSSISTQVLLPPGTQFVAATGKYTRLGNLVVFSRSSLANGLSTSETITVRSIGTGKTSAFATTFSSRTPDPAFRNNIATATVTVR